MNNNNKPFDKTLHDRLSTEELPFDPLAWEMMEDKLDVKPKRRFLFWTSTYSYALAGLVVLFLAGFTFWSLNSNNSEERNYSEATTVSDSKANTTTAENTTFETSNIIQSEEITRTSEKENKSSSEISKEIISEPLQNPISSAIDNVHESNPVRNNPQREQQSPNTYITPQSKKIEVNQNILRKKNTALLETGKTIPYSILEANESKDRNNSIDALSQIKNIKTSGLNYTRDNTYETDIVELVQTIDRPRHQINMTLGAGMTELDIDAPIVGDITPVAANNQEAFISLSYLYRMNRNWGIEIGAQAAGVYQQIGHYFDGEDFGLTVPEYGKTNVNAYEYKTELFSNIHFFLPLNQRSELDFYGGFYALNPFSQQGSWGSGAGSYSIQNNNNITLISSRVSGTSGTYNGGRVKLGMNYNFLTNKLNNVGIGIAYMHQIDNVVEGTYALIQSTEESRVQGNLRAHPSGFKVQMTYGFGLKRLPWSKEELKRPSHTLPWYISVRYGTKKYLLDDDLSKQLVNQHINKLRSIQVGHYIKQNMAFEFGLEYTEFVFKTPLEENFLLKSQKVFSVPFALRYDLLQANRWSLYSKAVFSTDFRVSHYRNFFESESGFATDENNLLPNAGLEGGIDFRIVKGVNIGLFGKYNKAFRRTAQYQYPELNTQNEIVFRDINLKNTNLSWGVELKYNFNTN